ncbi:ubiquinol-cytochrome C reductase [Russula vinacea]|nr:ubiquinol-cytochrome C reductase [Russula vinacea]
MLIEDAGSVVQDLKRRLAGLVKPSSVQRLGAVQSRVATSDSDHTRAHNLAFAFCQLIHPSMALSTAFYNIFVKRNSVYVTSIFAGAFAFGIGFDVAVSNFWDNWNRGKQWKDIRHKYIQDSDSE